MPRRQRRTIRKLATAAKSKKRALELDRAGAGGAEAKAKAEEFPEEVIKMVSKLVQKTDESKHSANKMKSVSVGCSYCKTQPESTDKNDAFQKCSKCRVAYYCSRDCQAADWPEHKFLCPTLEQAKNQPQTGYIAVLRA